ncbi:RDD family protein [Streptomyces drozdowiczii]
MSELVTGDAVVLGLRPAKLPSRALALAIDLIVVGTVFGLVATGLAVVAGSLDDAALAAVSVATFLLVPVGGPIAVETLSHGRSLGKMACGLRVVRDDGGPIRFRHALVRGAMGVVEILMTLGVVASIASLVSARGRRLGDVFAGTLVVRERVPAGRAAAVPPPPPWLVGRFAELDLSAVPDELWLAVRQYLTRMHQLDAAVGRAMSERLGGEVAARTGVPAPAGVPAAAYLAAVVHERQVRDARRAWQASQAEVIRGHAGAGPVGATGGAPAYGAPVPGAPAHGPHAGGGFAHPAVGAGDSGSGRPPATGFVPPA